MKAIFTSINVPAVMYAMSAFHSILQPLLPEPMNANGHLIVSS
jgi:hypothetical protein